MAVLCAISLRWQPKPDGLQQELTHTYLEQGLVRNLAQNASRCAWEASSLITKSRCSSLLGQYISNQVWMLNKAVWRGLSQVVFFSGYLPCQRKKHYFMSVTDSPLEASLKVTIFNFEKRGDWWDCNRMLQPSFSYKKLLGIFVSPLGWTHGTSKARSNMGTLFLFTTLGLILRTDPAQKPIWI